MKHVMALLFIVHFFTAIAQVRPVDLVKHHKGQFVEIPSALLSTEIAERFVDIPEECKNPVFLATDKNIYRQVLQQKNTAILLTLPIGERKNLVLELVEVNVTEQQTIITEPGNITRQVSQGKHYRGIIRGDESSLVAISLFEEEIMGFIASPELGGNLVLGKMETNDYHVLYEDEDIMKKLHFSCAVADDHDDPYTTDEIKGNTKGDRNTRCTRLYIEVDYDIYTGKGSSLTAVNNFVTGIFNQVGALYANENLTTALSEIVVWTQPSPYNGTTSIAMLNAFTGHRQGFNGDLAQLISYKASGGVAYVNGFCRSNPDHSMSFASIHSSYSNIPVYSWTVEVCAHELGHLFGSQHTHACVWNGNNTAIDGCYTPEGGCPTPAIPSGGGTIMSYCHLTSAGINFSNGFGTQPGNVMRSRVTTANCLGNCEGGGNQCSGSEVRLTIKVDSYPHETTWNLKNAANEIIYSGGPYSGANTIKTEDFCLADGCYTFTIFDSYGDGICCGYGQGYYHIKKGEVILGSGGQFTTTHVQTFCVTNGNAPTCTDGIQNGQETGIDCGGPACPPCATCNDGIKNGQETGIDCGGPTCPPCATCNDGIKNGQETGIDCGGPTCPPCATCNDGIKNGLETGVDCGGPACPPCATCNDGIKNGQETGIDCGGPACPPCGGTLVETNLAGYYFESGWDGWTRGGTYAARYQGSLSPEGQFSIRISDNQQELSSFSSPNLALAGYDSVKVEFRFLASSVEPGESFTLRYFNGSQWQIVQTFVSGTHFQNNIVYTRVVKIAAGLMNNAKIRFQIAGSDSFDRIYIDAVRVLAYQTLSSGPSCTDGIKNGQETGVDCGGPTCPPCATCTDGIKNGQETGVDCGGPTCPPCATCNDGIKNGQETGVDCGGPTCPPCATCNDGIKNGQETSVDCGGPVCPPCATCQDGIKNGQETGVDCGGPDCPPCNTGNEVMIGGYYFETGWDGWLDGGDHCFRYGGSFSPEGTYSIRMRNSGLGSTTTSPVFNLQPYQTVKVAFRFKASGMENGKSFSLQYFNGSVYNNSATFTVGNDFVNSVTYNVTITLTGNFAANARFRFINQGTDNTDYIFIDAVVITAHTGNALIENPKWIDVLDEDGVEYEEDSLILYPNPVFDQLNYNLTDVPAKIKIFDTTGKLIVETIVTEPVGKLELQEFPKGMYIMIAETAHDVFNSRFVKD